MTAAPTGIRALIVDDEPLARANIARLLGDEPDIQIVGEAGGGSAAIRLIQSTRADLVFLDVQMPGCSGFDVLRAVAPQTPAVVFVTAYDSHAIGAFDVAAVDYIVKPVVEARFRAAVRRAVARVRAENVVEMTARISSLLDRIAPAAPQRIPIRTDGRVVLVAADEIDWIHAMDDHIRIHIGRTVHRTRETMARMESRLPATFVRVHRSVIVNRERIREIQPWVKGDYVVVLNDGTKLTSGRTFRDRVRALLE